MSPAQLRSTKASSPRVLFSCNQRASTPLPVRQGSYIVLPREHAPLIKDQLGKYKIMNGFLVPNEAQDLDISPEMVAGILPGLTYLSLGVGVRKTKINTCSAGAAKA